MLRLNYALIVSFEIHIVVMKSPIKTYPPLTHAEDLKQVCKPLESLGISYFCHVHIDKQKQFTAIGKVPEFAKLYLEKSFYNYDIHMAQQQNDQQYILWDLLNLSDESEQLYRLTQEFGIHHTFTISQLGDQGKEYFHFATTEQNHQANQLYLQQLDYLQQFILYFKDKINAHKALASSYQYKFSISESEAKFSNQVSPAVIQEQLLGLNRIYIDDKGTYLTQRELECLHYLSLAKTIDEIALILSITPRTVNAHIANIKEKTQRYNQFQLGELYQQLKKHLQK